MLTLLDILEFWLAFLYYLKQILCTEELAKRLSRVCAYTTCVSSHLFKLSRMFHIFWLHRIIICAFCSNVSECYCHVESDLVFMLSVHFRCSSSQNKTYRSHRLQPFAHYCFFLSLRVNSQPPQWRRVIAPVLCHEQLRILSFPPRSFLAMLFCVYSAHKPCSWTPI